MDNNKYNKFKLKVSNDTMETICKPNKFKLQPQQEFLSKYLFDNKKTIKGLLIYHRIGSGKTCTAINIAEKFINSKKYNIIVVLPAALIGNFRDELRSQCPQGVEYITKTQNNQLKNLKPTDKIFKNIIEDSNKKIDENYTIYSYHKFIELINDKKIKLKNTLLIIDEIQNMISMTGTFYKTLKNLIDKTDDSLRLLLLSATPMFDRPNEIALTLNLLRPKIPLPIGNEFNNKFLKIKKNNLTTYYEPTNLDKFSKLTKNMISYYRGAPPQAFPKMEFLTVKCKMSKFQYKSYLTSLSTIEGYDNIKGFKNTDILKLPPDFFLGPRMISNIAFPNKSIGELGFSSLKNNTLQLQNIKNYSIKFYKIFKKIKISTGPIFIYSNFKDIGGLKSLIHFIEYQGYKNYTTFGSGNKRYAIWSGDEPHHIKEEIKYVFNQKENKDGSNIKIMLGSPSIKEGVSLLRIDQIHILEPYWNISRIDQIIGRGIRFCSHKDMPKNKRLVQVFLYLATFNKEQTIDQYIWSIAKKKHQLIKEFEHILKENAIDCKLFHARNYYPKIDENKLICNTK